MTVLSKLGVLLVGREATEGTERIGTVQTAANDKTTFALKESTFTEADDYFNTRKYLVVGVSGDNAGIARRITDWTLTGRKMVCDAFPTGMSTGDTVIIVKAVLAEGVDGDRGQDQAERKVWDSSKGISERGPIPTGWKPSFKFQCDWRNSGTTAGTQVPDYAPFIDAAGLYQSGGTNLVAFKLNTGGAANQKSVTAYEYHKDGIYRKYTGVKCDSMDFNSEAGGIPKVSFACQAIGITTSTASQPSLPASAFNEITALPVLGATFKLAGVATDVSKFGWSVKNTVKRVESEGAASGTSKLVIADRKITANFNPEATASTWLGYPDAATTQTASWSDGSNGNKSTITFPKLQYTKVSGPTDDGGVERFNCETKAIYSAGNDEIKVVVQ